MANLAKFSDLKALVGKDGTSNDASLALCLAQASSIAERLAGVSDGALRRRVGIVEFPDDGSMPQSRYTRLGCRPVESIADIRQLYSPDAPVAFEAATPLERYSDFDFDSRFGRLERFNGAWLLRPRCLRVTYTAGFVDPSTEISDWEDGEDYEAGDLVNLVDQVYCARVDHTADSDMAPPALDMWDLVHQVPQDMQFAVVQQALRMWQTQENAGASEVTYTGGKSMSFKQTEVHPALIEACKPWRLLL